MCLLGNSRSTPYRSRRVCSLPHASCADLQCGRRASAQAVGSATLLLDVDNSRVLPWPSSGLSREVRLEYSANHESRPVDGPVLFVSVSELCCFTRNNETRCCRLRCGKHVLAPRQPGGVTLAALQASCGLSCGVRPMKRKPRCIAIAQGRRVRMMCPRLGRLYGQLEDYLIQEPFGLDDTELLRRLSCRFLRVPGDLVALRLLVCGVPCKPGGRQAFASEAKPT